MINSPPRTPTFPGAARIALGALVIVVAVGALLRTVLFAQFAPSDASNFEVALLIANGAFEDTLVAAVLLTPFAIAVACFGRRWLVRPFVRSTFFAVFAAAVAFESVVEYFYFEEFDARFNNIAVDYVLYPHEVVGNVFESYNVPLYVALALSAGALAAWSITPLVRTVRLADAPWRTRFGEAGVSALIGAVGLGGLYVWPRELSANRVLNEIGASGPVQLVRAFWSAELDYPLYYRTLPSNLARPRAARLLGFERNNPAAPWSKRLVPSAPRSRPSQVVVVIEESLGSDFVGGLGRAKAPCTPEFDRWMADGLVMRNLMATGNRTVRGLEGVLCSFVPLPGDALIKRSKSDDVTTLASVFSAEHYATAFYYGGYGVFDSMKPFMLTNGFSEFIEQPDYPSDAFRTIWGVADEYVFDALLARQRLQRERGEPFFATLLSASNHKPYRVPPGRPGFDEENPKRTGAVTYADWCIGRYLDQLRADGMLDDTLVLIVGDHGARVYGAEEIPSSSYRIPALFVGGPMELRGRSIDRLCSQIDLAPTLLDLCGIEVRVPFFGSSVLGLPDEGGRAFVHHNRDIGLLVDDALVVLRLRKGLAFYTREGRAGDVFTSVPVERAPPQLLQLADDAAAVFGTAHELYETRGLGALEAKTSSTASMAR